MQLVSVIIATYNRSNILHYTIASVLKQDYPHFEIIVVGDCCTDDTEQVVKAFQDKRISFINLEQNHGEQSRPNNVGFQMSKGELVAWLNHDDLWFPDHLSTMIRHLNEENADLVYAWYFPWNYKKFGWDHILPVYFEENRYRPFYFVPASTWLVKREAIQKIGLWESAFNLYTEPSRNWISRLYKQGLKIVPVSKLTVIAIQSGYRKNSYKNRSQEEHALVFGQMYQPGFREEILTYLCYQLSLRAQTLSVLKHIKAILLKPIKWAMINFDIDPTGFLRWLKHRKKGGHIAKLRKTRGLNPLKKQKQCLKTQRRINRV